MTSTTSKSTIYREIRRSIIMGHRKPGERLDVNQIARQYNTSITPLRDALQMLTQEGLVTIKPRSGYFVTRMTLKQLRDMMELRKILELAAVERAATRITSEQIQELRLIHAGYTGDDDESYDRYTDENRRFHYTLALASGNMELAETIGRLHDRLARFMVLRHAGLSQEFTHAKIVDALENHDIEAARRALLDDIEPSHDEIIDEILEERANSWHVDAIR
ncbi:MAG: GntR family transcriptional regulator [Anaerolineales bacterium]